MKKSVLFGLFLASLLALPVKAQSSSASKPLAPTTGDMTVVMSFKGTADTPATVLLDLKGDGFEDVFFGIATDTKTGMINPGSYSVTVESDSTEAAEGKLEGFLQGVSSTGIPIIDHFILYPLADCKTADDFQTARWGCK